MAFLKKHWRLGWVLSGLVLGVIGIWLVYQLWKRPYPGHWDIMVSVENQERLVQQTIFGINYLRVVFGVIAITGILLAIIPSLRRARWLWLLWLGGMALGASELAHEWQRDPFRRNTSRLTVPAICRDSLYSDSSDWRSLGATSERGKRRLDLNKEAAGKIVPQLLELFPNNPSPLERIRQLVMGVKPHLREGIPQWDFGPFGIRPSVSLGVRSYWSEEGTLEPGSMEDSRAYEKQFHSRKDHRLLLSPWLILYQEMEVCRIHVVMRLHDRQLVVDQTNLDASRPVIATSVNGNGLWLAQVRKLSSELLAQIEASKLDSKGASIQQREQFWSKTLPRFAGSYDADVLWLLHYLLLQHADQLGTLEPQDLVDIAVADIMPKHIVFVKRLSEAVLEGKLKSMPIGFTAYENIYDLRDVISLDGLRIDTQR